MNVLAFVTDLTRRKRRRQMETKAVRRSHMWVSPKWSATSRRIITNSCVWTTEERPNSSVTWFTQVTIAAAEVKPDITGVEMKFIRKPARSIFAKHDISVRIGCQNCYNFFMSVRNFNKGFRENSSSRFSFSIFNPFSS